MTADAPRDGRHARSDSTRERILLAAEQLFAELGIANVSLRDVGVAAGQKNNGAVQYHFGDRDNLVLQIVTYRARFTEEVRTKLLAEIAATRKEPEVRDYVMAFVRSLAGNLGEGNYFLRFLSRLVIERGSIPIQAVPDENILFMKGIMRQLLPHLSDAIIEERWNISMFSTVHMLAGYQAAEKERALSAPLDALLDDLVNFLTAGLQAPAPVPASSPAPAPTKPKRAAAKRTPGAGARPTRS